MRQSPYDLIHFKFSNVKIDIQSFARTKFGESSRFFIGAQVSARCHFPTIMVRSPCKPAPETQINFVQTIRDKRDGKSLSCQAIEKAIFHYAAGEIPDYQMAAFAMAIVLKGMSRDETVGLTRAMLESGSTLQWDAGDPVVDKHSTGGIGDKVSIPLAPMLACCGVRVPMISGRGLGPTGGTLDKLESIAGFRTDFSMDEITTQVNDVGCMITGATPEIAPADRKLYALRDVTATVESIPLITASILSKKLAAGLDALILDVKFGSGAFMKSLTQAKELAKSLVSVGNELGVKTTAILSDMNQTLGITAGNRLEIEESISTLKGKGPADLVELTLELGANLLASVFPDETADRQRKRLQQTIDDGSALEKFHEMVTAQNGSISRFQSPEANSNIQRFPVIASQTGYIAEINAEEIGWVVIEMGGGRKQLSDSIDHQTGVRQLKRLGNPVKQGEPLAEILIRGESATANHDSSERLLSRLSKAFTLSEQKPSTTPLFYSVNPEQDR